MSGGLRRRVKNQWARLTDGDLDYVGGQATRLLDRLEERYGYTRPKAERELLRFLDLVSPIPLRGMRAVGGVGGAPPANTPRR